MVRRSRWRRSRWRGLPSSRRSAALTPYPAVLSDEATYLLTTLFGYDADNFARWGIVGQIPNHVYYGIYAKLGAADVYLKAKLLNAAFVAGAALPVWLTARRYLAPWPATAFAAAAIAAPLCTFVRYFMPESLYVFGFWWIVWLVLVRAPHVGIEAGVAIGIALGLLSLVKPHALALVAGIALFFALRSGRRSDRMLAVACLALTYFATRVGVGYALSGILDFSVTGPAYRGALIVKWFEPGAIAFNALGHATALLLLAGLPLAAILGALVRKSGPPLDGRLRDLMLLAACTLGALVAMTVWFSYTVHLVDPAGERITRLHGRYYAFALPLVLLAYAALVRSRQEAPALFSNSALAVFAVATLAAFVVVARGYESSVVDYPDLGILPRWPNGLIVPAIALAGCAIAVRVLRRPGFDDGLWRRVLPLAWWAGIAVTTSLLLLAAPLAGKWFVPSDVDTAMTASPLRELRRRDDGMVVGTYATRADTHRVLFHLASRSRGRIMPPGTVLASEAIPPDVNWLILLPGAVYEGAGERKAAGPLGYVLLR